MGRRASPNTDIRLPVSQLAESFGLDRATVTKRLNEVDAAFEPGPHGAKLYLVTDAIRACIRDFLGADQPGTYEEARARDMKARAQLTELDLAVRRAQLLPAVEVEETWSEYIGRANTRLGSIATALAPLLVSETDEAAIEAMIDDAIDEVRSELARDAEDTDGGDEEVDADAEADGQRMGGPEPDAEPGGERGTGAMEHDEE